MLLKKIKCNNVKSTQMAFLPDSETCRNRTILEPVFVFGISRSSVYAA